MSVVVFCNHGCMGLCIHYFDEDEKKETFLVQFLWMEWRENKYIRCILIFFFVFYIFQYGLGLLIKCVSIGY